MADLIFLSSLEMLYICQMKSRWAALSTVAYMGPASTCVIQVTKKCTEWESAKDVSAVTERVSKLSGFVNGF